MTEQHIFEVWHEGRMKASCHSTNRSEAESSARDLAEEVGSTDIREISDEPSAYKDWLHEQDCPISNGERQCP
jgi:hypothetical protein